MKLDIDWKQKVAGIKMTRIRDGMRDIYNYPSLYADRVEERLQVYFKDKTNEVIQWLIEEGYLEKEENKLCKGYLATDKGRHFALKKAWKPISRKKADQAVENLIMVLSELNADDYHPFHCKNLYIYGSYLDETQDLINDIDIGLDIETLLPREQLTELSLERHYESEFNLGPITSRFFCEYEHQKCIQRVSRYIHRGIDEDFDDPKWGKHKCIPIPALREPKTFEECLTISKDKKASVKEIMKASTWVKKELRANGWQFSAQFMVSAYVFRCQNKKAGKNELYFCDDELNLSIPSEELQAYLGLYRHLIGNSEASVE